MLPTLKTPKPLGLRTGRNAMIPSRKRGAPAALAIVGLLALGPAAWAQGGPVANPVTSIDSPYPYKTSQEHFEALRRAANGGTKHTAATLPDWTGYWSADPSRGLI